MKVKRFFFAIGLCSLIITGCNKTRQKHPGTTNETSSSTADDDQIRHIYALYQNSGGEMSYEEWFKLSKEKKVNQDKTAKMV